MSVSICIARIHSMFEKRAHATYAVLTCERSIFFVTIPPAVRPTILRQMDMGSVTCAHIYGACRAHWVTDWLTLCHWVVHWLIHSLTVSHWLVTHSPTHFQSLSHSLSYSLHHSVSYSLIGRLTVWLTDLVTHTLIQSIRQFINPMHQIKEINQSIQPRQFDSLIDKNITITTGIFNCTKKIKVNFSRSINTHLYMYSAVCP